MDRREFLRLAGAAAVAASAYSCGGSGSGEDDATPAAAKDKAAAKPGGGERTLRIAQWSHFIPRYDVWFDAEYTQRWGEEHDVDVVVDVLAEAPKLRAGGYPVGIGLSPDDDSNFSLYSLMAAFGARVQDEESRLALNSPETVGAVKLDETAQPTDKYALLGDAESWTTNTGYPGHDNAATDEVFYQFIVPKMFAAAARGEVSPEEAVATAEAQARPIFDKWRERGKI